MVFNMLGMVIISGTNPLLKEGVLFREGRTTEKNKLNSKRPSWKWFAVKLLFEYVVSGIPSIDTIDENYSDKIKSYEESIILVRAQSFEQAYKIAEKKAKEAEMVYQNPYDEMVQCKLVKELDAFELFDETLSSGTELYSRFIQISKDVTTDDVIKQYYPESVTEDEEGPDFNWIFRFKEFNKRPGKRE